MNLFIREGMGNKGTLRYVIYVNDNSTPSQKSYIRYGQFRYVFRPATDHPQLEVTYKFIQKQLKLQAEIILYYMFRYNPFCNSIKTLLK
jgi:hypothetical protein